MKPSDTTTDKNFDKVSGTDDRKELLEQLMFSLQSSVGETLSDVSFGSVVDNVSNALYAMSAYGESLKTAADEIQNTYPIDDDISSELTDISDIAGALMEGVNRATEYLNVVRKFVNDVSSIQSELYLKLQNLHSEP